MIRLAFFVVVMCTTWGSLNAFAQSAQGKLEKLAQEAARSSANDTLEPNEINTVERRRKLMGQPGLQFYVIFFSNRGAPIEYFVTDGKCTSSKKRLIMGWEFRRGQVGYDSDNYAKYGDYVLGTPSLDGTSGQSDEYIYCFTVNGVYKQWNGRYYASDSPIELTVKPLIIDLSAEIQQQN